MRYPASRIGVKPSLRAKKNNRCTKFDSLCKFASISDKNAKIDFTIVERQVQKLLLVVFFILTLDDIG